MNFEINKVYNFNTISRGILGASYENMKVVAVMTAAEASIIEDVSSIHTRIKSEVTNVSLPIDYRDCTYIKFQTKSGLNKVLAVEYIDQSSIQTVVSKKLVITINNFTLSDPSSISDLLKERGYWDFHLAVVD